MKNPNPSVLNIGNNIKKIRILKGITRETMAEALCICTKQYANIENDKCRLDVERFLKIATILEVDTAVLIKLDERMFFRN